MNEATLISAIVALVATIGTMWALMRALYESRIKRAEDAATALEVCNDDLQRANDEKYERIIALTQRNGELLARVSHLTEERPGV